MRRLVLLLCTGVTCCIAAGGAPGGGRRGGGGGGEDATEPELVEEKRERVPVSKSQVKFNLRSWWDGEEEEEGCPLAIGHHKRLEECKFNVTAKSFFIIHGWTMSGMFETWLDNLVAALQEREKDANVVVVDWLPLAHQLYTDAVNNTQIVGKSIARLLDWLQENPLFQLENVHLIGYSLGAHVAGFAGNHVHGTIGRITGLDPAGPMFEGVDPSKRLSPDDANFVDVLHTWEGTTQSWYDLWKELKSYWYRPAKSAQELHIRRIRVKSQRLFGVCFSPQYRHLTSPLRL